MSKNQPEKSVTLGLGGNIGDVVDTLCKALDQLQALEQVDIVQVSPLYKTPPWGFESQDWFINACVEISTSLQPLVLLEKCQAIETALHRKRTLRWGPRTIDIDILTFEDFLSDDGVLTIPHPRMLERAFVLVPLADIASALIVSGKSVATWCDMVDKTGIESIEVDTPWWPNSA